MHEAKHTPFNNNLSAESRPSRLRVGKIELLVGSDAYILTILIFLSYSLLLQPLSYSLETERSLRPTFSSLVPFFMNV